MAQIVGEKVSARATRSSTTRTRSSRTTRPSPGEKAFVFYHCVPFESSASLVNLLTATRILPQGVRDAPRHVRARIADRRRDARLSRRSATRASPGNMNYNKQLQRFMDEGGHVYACRFSAAALYGMREIDMMEGVKPINPRDVLDAAITAWRERALTLNTWTM